MHLILTTLIALFLLTGCEVPEPEDPRVREAKVAVKKRVKDPASVQFGSVFVHKGWVCGWYNAKNSFGGYTGSERFIYEVDTGYLEVPTGTHGWYCYCEEPQVETETKIAKAEKELAKLGLLESAGRFCPRRRK